MANGRGAGINPASALAREAFLAVAEVTGNAAQARIVLAAAITLHDIETHFADRIEARTETTFDTIAARLRGRESRRLGALVLAERAITVVPDADAARLLANGLIELGLDRLPWSKPLRQWRERVMFLRQIEDSNWPDLTDAALAARANEWLVPVLIGKTAVADLSAVELAEALSALVPRHLRRRIETEAPTHFPAPSGSSVPIDYAAEDGPRLSIRVQELFGLDRHPTVAGGRVPLTIELLSPAQRPVQVTRDLPGFWRGSYAAVRAEMRGRYPRHPWPDDPLVAAPTRRVKHARK
jgi:ATP-dependent helicase HrpB